MLEVRYLVTGGSDRESSSFIQVDGQRYDGTGGKNTFRLQTLSSHYRFNLVNGDVFRLSVAPGVQATHVAIKTQLPATTLSSSESSFGLGVKLGTGISLSDTISLEQEFAMASHQGERFLSLGMWLNYDVDNKSRLRLGFSGEYLGTRPLSFFGGDNGDGCTSLEVPEGTVCRDSRLKASSSGVHVGFLYRL